MLSLTRLRYWCEVLVVFGQKGFFWGGSRGYSVYVPGVPAN